jgi:hypothetical protein
MRIRTIKPEFWTSETIAPLSPDAKLLAIGLLNYADDEGYFWANPVLIHAAIFPFLDSSTTLLGLIQELSRVGYISLGERTDDHRKVGKVINFLIHQRIDKPKQSIIKQNVQFVDESKTHPGRIPDASQQEGKGKEQGKEWNGTEERERDFPEIPPMSRKEFDAMADRSAVPKDCAEWFWNTYDARNWLDGHGQPIRKVQPLLMNTLKSWRGVGATKKYAGAKFPVQPVLHHIPDATFDSRTPEEIAEQEARRRA